jgi:hypothetical protein
MKILSLIQVIIYLLISLIKFIYLIIISINNIQ